MAGTKYHVIARSKGNWSVLRSDASRVTRTFSTKEAAINNARKLVASSGGGELVIHTKDGRVSARNDIAPPLSNGNSSTQ
jgi:hypothetical protein